MTHLHTAIETPHQSVGGTLLKVAIVATLIVIGFKLGYCTDPDWDRDGLPNKIETRFYLNPHNADSDGDGVRDGKEAFTFFHGAPTPSSDTLLADEVCLTGADGQKDVCFHPAEILLFEIKNERFICYDWKGKGKYVQENLIEIEREMHRIGYTHFYRVSRQDLANILLAECFDKKNSELWLSLEEEISCHVPRDKAQYMAGLFEPCDDND